MHFSSHIYRYSSIGHPELEFFIQIFDVFLNEFLIMCRLEIVLKFKPLKKHQVVLRNNDINQRNVKEELQFLHGTKAKLAQGTLTFSI